ncbi:hypothetical protein D5R81_19905 [Parashewanella spongiae]|uniref:Uncharacterized protein n=2 Tax=Parashewanella spongiae TaxID=342950 RepID=A0A3A6T4R6_9GAMM|nr:hypothetical protein D5R81_19905 [Parashewanella spongiae]
MVLNGSGIRDTERVLNIHKDTVINAIKLIYRCQNKQKRSTCPNTRPATTIYREFTAA